ncbi:hypothetical protein C6T52_29885 [Burkholderia multivorans]|nr:hypothetical protein C6T52_29885 [Burkholderia multivorans]
MIRFTRRCRYSDTARWTASCASRTCRSRRCDEHRGAPACRARSSRRRRTRCIANDTAGARVPMPTKPADRLRSAVGRRAMRGPALT